MITPPCALVDATGAEHETVAVFEHLRASDGEHVGWIAMTSDDRFVPIDRLHRVRGAAMALEEAEALLEETGLRMLVDSWILLADEGEGTGDSNGEGAATPVRIAELRVDSVTVVPALDDLSGPIAKAIDLTKQFELALPAPRLVPLAEYRK